MVIITIMTLILTTMNTFRIYPGVFLDPDILKQQNVITYCSCYVLCGICFQANSRDVADVARPTSCSDAGYVVTNWRGPLRCTTAPSPTHTRATPGLGGWLDECTETRGGPPRPKHPYPTL